MKPKQSLPSFEESLVGLEKVVERLESGDAGLEETVALFEDGMRHAALCRKRLEEAENRIAVLTKKAGEAVVSDEDAADLLGRGDG